MKKMICIMVALGLMASMVGMFVRISVSAVTDNTFTFNGTMSKEVLRNYASRAVTSWIVLEGSNVDPIFEEDLRMTQRVGAKYLARAASLSWSGYLSTDQINEHFALAKEKATTIHNADPEMIIQAGVFEIVYQDTVNNTAIPAWVFQDFGLPVVTRNFIYSDVAFPTGHRFGPGYWGNSGSAVPKIANIEAQMYFYYNICRYIDAGFEAIHLGQTEMMMDYLNVSNAVDWDRVTTLARAYAVNHARRGIVLFDGHSDINSTGLKVGDRLILDIQAAPLVPNETVSENGAMKCEIGDYNQYSFTWIGRSAGGIHPLGFNIDHNITILEFDNYGVSATPGVATPNAFYVWGYDDITWFALQPEWYRNQFLTECNNYLKNNSLDSEGKQVYFIEPSLRRIITGSQTLTYTPGNNYNADFALKYFARENTGYSYNGNNSTYNLTVTKDYRANRQSDGCPNGSNQEDTIKDIFLGNNAPEDPELLQVVLPSTSSLSTERQKIVCNVFPKGATFETDIDKFLTSVAGDPNSDERKYIIAPFSTADATDSGGTGITRWLTSDKGITVYKFDLADTTSEFKVSIFEQAWNYKVYASRDNNTWLQIGINTEVSMPSAFRLVNYPNNTSSLANMNSILVGNPKKMVYIKLEVQSGGGLNYQQLSIEGKFSKTLDTATAEVAMSVYSSTLSPADLSTFKTELKEGGTISEAPYITSYDPASVVNWNGMGIYRFIYGGTSATYMLDLDNKALDFDISAWGQAGGYTIEVSKNGTGGWLPLIDNNEDFGTQTLKTQTLTPASTKANVVEVLQNNIEKIVYLKITGKGINPYDPKFVYQNLIVKYSYYLSQEYYDSNPNTTYTGILVANPANRTDFDPKPEREDYFNNYYIEGGSPLYWLWTTLNSSPAVFKFDLPDITTNFEPVFAGYEFSGTFKIYASKNNINWYVVAEMTSQYIEGAVYNSTTGLYFGDPATPDVTEGREFNIYNSSNMNTVLDNNPSKIVYLKIGDIVSTAPDEWGSRIQLRYFGITYEYSNASVNIEATTNIKLSTITSNPIFVANASNSADYAPQPFRDDYFNNYYVEGGSSLYWLWKTFNNSQAVFKYDLPDITTNFEPVFAGYEFSGTFKIYASKNNINWYVVAEMTSQYIEGAVYNSTTGLYFGDPATPDVTEGREFNIYNSSNMNTVLKNNPSKIVYLKIGDIVSTTPDQYGSRIQLRYLGLTCNIPLSFNSYKVSTEKYISNIKSNSTVASFKAGLQTGTSAIVLKDKSGNGNILANGDSITTGTIIEVTNGAITETYKTVIYGDTTGDGILDIIDLAAVKSHLLKISYLEGIYKAAADISNKGSISISDLLALKKDLLGISSIVQVIQVPAVKVTVNKSAMSISSLSTGNLTAMVSPANSTNKLVSWTTSNGAVATVNSSGVVTGVSVGTATITVRTVDGGATATCTVTIT